jgi:hypothetical protein
MDMLRHTIALILAIGVSAPAGAVDRDRFLLACATVKSDLMPEATQRYCRCVWIHGVEQSINPALSERLLSTELGGQSVPFDGAVSEQYAGQAISLRDYLGGVRDLCMIGAALNQLDAGGKPIE